MARTVKSMELQPDDPRKPQDAKNAQGRDAAPMGDPLLEQILENMDMTPPEEVLQRIASLPDIRRGKVLDIRRRLREGTYEVAGRLDRAMDRVLEDCVFVFDAGCWRRTSHRMTMTCCTV
jgi:hypothetical protein